MISIIIPTKNRPVLIKECLQCLSEQNSPELLEEIIVIDDYSSIDYRKEIIDLAEDLDLNLIFIKNNEKAGAAGARNVGIKITRGEIIAFLDDDALADPDWLDIIKEKISDEMPAITGAIRPMDHKHLLSRSRQLRYDMRRAKALKANTDVKFLAGGNSAVYRDVLIQADMFNTDFELMHDRELIFKINKLGKKCYYIDDLKIRHYHHKGLFRALIRAYQSGGYRKSMENNHHKFIKAWHPREFIKLCKELKIEVKKNRSHFFPALISLAFETVHLSGYFSKTVQCKLKNLFYLNKPNFEKPIYNRKSEVRHDDH